MSKSIARITWRTLFFIIGMFALHFATGSENTDTVRRQGEDMPYAFKDTTFYTDNCGHADRHTIGCIANALHQTAFTRTSNSGQATSHHIAKNAQHNWCALMLSRNRTNLTACGHPTFTSLSYSRPCEYYIFALRKILI